MYCEARLGWHNFLTADVVGVAVCLPFHESVTALQFIFTDSSAPPDPCAHYVAHTVGVCMTGYVGPWIHAVCPSGSATAAGSTEVCGIQTWSTSCNAMALVLLLVCMGVVQSIHTSIRQYTPKSYYRIWYVHVYTED